MHKNILGAISFYKVVLSARRETIGENVQMIVSSV